MLLNIMLWKNTLLYIVIKLHEQQGLNEVDDLIHGLYDSLD